MAYQTRLLLDQLDALRQAGQWDSAIDLCDRLYDQAVSNEDLDEVIDVIIRKGFIYASAGDRDAAVDNFTASAKIAELSGIGAQVARSLNGLGIIRQQYGNLTDAQDLYNAALAEAAVASAATVSGDILTNLGIIASIRGDINDALRRYLEAEEYYSQSSEKQRVARLQNNIGLAYKDLGDLEAAGEALEIALNIARSLSDYSVECIVLSNQTEVHIEAGKLELARATCDRSFEIANRLGDNDLRVKGLMLYGRMFRIDAQLDMAEAYLLQASDVASEVDNKLRQAELSKEVSVLYRQMGRNREALENFIATHNLFSELQAELETADVAAQLASLEEDFMELVHSWGESIEAKDRYTVGHCGRVADYACQLARAVGVSELEMGWFRMGAFLHDVGKTETPEDILNKPGKLTDSERRIIEHHTIAGDRILAPIEFPWDIRPMVRSHHERWDGAGYPDGLEGTAIPFTARILHVVDVFDALTSARSYRDPLSKEKALEIMNGDEGSFDPELLAVFCRLLDEEDQTAASESSAVQARA